MQALSCSWAAVRDDEPGVGYEWWVQVSAVHDGTESTYRIPTQGTFKAARLAADGVYWSDLRTPRACRPGSPGCWA